MTCGMGAKLINDIQPIKQVNHARYTNLTPITLQGILGVTVVLEIHFLGSKGMGRVKCLALPVYAKAEKVLQESNVVAGNLQHPRLQAGSEMVGWKRPLCVGGGNGVCFIALCISS